MSAVGWDRDAYLALRRAARNDTGASTSTAPPVAPVVAGGAPHPRRTLGQRLARINGAMQTVMDPLAGMTMYSSDPQLARSSMLYTAQRELQKFKESQADQQAWAIAQREEDLASEERRMRLLGRVVADEMVKRVDEQRGRGGR